MKISQNICQNDTYYNDMSSVNCQNLDYFVFVICYD